MDSRCAALVVLSLVSIPSPALVAQDVAAEPPSATLTVHADRPGPVVNPNVYGHFAEHLGRCIYGGIWVGEDSAIPNVRGIRRDVVDALKALRVPVLRWPGGCFADEYHWKDGIGPRSERPKTINTHWGGVIEANHFGTHEFMDLCELIGAEPYIALNVGSGTVEEAMQWVEYLTSTSDSEMAELRRRNGREEPWRVRYFGIGNESWGCGGNMRPEYYADLCRRYGTYVKSYGGNRVVRVACGSHDTDYRWTEVLMREAGRRMEGLSLHYYTIPSGSWGRKGSATRFDEDEWHTTLWRALEMDTYLTKHSEIMDIHDREKRVGLYVDEWGTWYDVEPGTESAFLYQQNTLRDAMVAALTFHVFHRHADRVVMANIAQTVNVLQAMILTEREKMLLTPTYHVFEMFAVHQGGTSLPVESKAPDFVVGERSIPGLSASATQDQSGAIHLSLVNPHPRRLLHVTCGLTGAWPESVHARILTAESIQAHNTFDRPDAVRPRELGGVHLDGATLELDLPPKSIVVLELR